MQSARLRAVRQRLAPHRHGIVLAACVALFLTSFALPRFVGEVLFMITISALVWVEGGHRRVTRYALLALAAVVGATIIGDLCWSTHSAWQKLLEGALGTCLLAVVMLFLIYCVITVLWSLLHARRVTPDRIMGAVVIYMLAAMIWGYAYNILDRTIPGSLTMAAPREQCIWGMTAAERRRSRLMYFSFITLATQGYGDITAQNIIAERLVILETIFGQFYVAVVVAYLVSMLMKEQPASQPVQDGGFGGPPAEQ